MDASEYTTKQEIDGVTERLHTRFASLATQTLEYRLFNLKQLGYLVKDNEAALVEALRRDLDRSGANAVLEDLYVVYNDVELAVKRVAEWMKDESRMRDVVSGYAAMDCRVTKQPKGVALIIGPWNYPIQCTLAPLVAAVSAGCPAVIKPSELAPNCARILQSLIPKYLDPEAYAVVHGSIDETTHLLEKKWGHIFFTGSTRVGKVVATAAAKTLTSSSLELGGKSPVIIAPCANLKVMAKRFLSMKVKGGGQACVSPDYILCPKERVDELISILTHELRMQWPNAPHPDSFILNPAYSAQITQGHFDRQMTFLRQAEREGKLVHRGEVDEKRRRLGISIVKCSPGAVDEENGIVHEEIFGSVIPIIPVDDVDAAIKYVNERPNPLSLYVCAKDSGVFEKVKRETISGAITFNDFVIAVTARTLPFGGVGESGWGSYRGYDGFRSFTHFKSTLKVPMYIEPIMSIRYNPSSKVKEWITRKLFCIETPYNRPTSVEGERKRLIRRRIRKWALAIVFGLLATWFGSKWAIANSNLSRWVR